MPFPLPVSDVLTSTWHLGVRLRHSCALLSSSCVLQPSNWNLQLRPCVTFLQCLLLPVCLLQMARDSVPDPMYTLHFPLYHVFTADDTSFNNFSQGINCI